MSSYPTLPELFRRYESERDDARYRARIATEKVQRILDQATEAGRANLTVEEGRTVKEIMKERDEASAAAHKVSLKIEELNHVRAEEAERERKSRDIHPTQASFARGPSYDRVLRVGAEERTYRPDRDPKGENFVRDVARQFMLRDINAEDRLRRHMVEEERDRGDQLTRAVGTGALSVLVVPQYLTELYAPAIAAMRPFADICNRHTLPTDGMTVNISRITTPTSVGLQGTENTAVSEQNIDDTVLTENVQTAAGQQTMSRQSIERGTLTEEVVLEDLFKRYATTLDSTLINQATTGLSALAQATTYTSASPTVAELWPKLFGAQNNLEAALLAQSMPTHFVMHPRRWNWMTSQVGTSWPTIAAATNPPQAFGVSLTNEYGPSVRGVLSNGMRVTVDANVPTNKGTGTNEDELYAVAADELHLWEDPNAPVFIRAEQPAAASLGVLLVVYGYFAFSFRRYPNGVGKVSGTGMVGPTF